MKTLFYVPIILLSLHEQSQRTNSNSSNSSKCHNYNSTKQTIRRTTTLAKSAVATRYACTTATSATASKNKLEPKTAHQHLRSTIAAVYLAFRTLKCELFWMCLVASSPSLFLFLRDSSEPGHLELVVEGKAHLPASDRRRFSDWGICGRGQRSGREKIGTGLDRIWRSS